ncbi:MAG TPA: aminotransferase class I/II-fold pyridoxal phosphate-dependent enzyme, partial [Acidimicrobiales bacterium]|nr:aminotransferase class I/II-fold pyridoxal phosphate-dependent enzyme [Acidimicrobiales bacterium]
MTTPERTATEVPTGFVPPPYPYDRLESVRAMAVDRFGDRAEGSGSAGSGGIVDCSIGTPNDPPPAFVIEALASSGAERGYPASIGSAAYRRAGARWLERRFGAHVDPDRELAACVGTKEFVASAAQYLHLRSPDRDTVLYPAISYPTYAMGAVLGGCRAVPVPELAGGGLDLGSVDEADADRALMLWANSPSNPTGLLTDLGATAAWGRARRIPVFSDECYAEFTWDGPPRSILTHGLDGVIAVQSLSKRSNLAGVRAGFFAGDPDLVEYLLVVRRHAGLMVPGPVQAAAAVALDDDAHVDEQRQRYRQRLSFLADVLGRWGLPVSTPAGGFYLWAPVPAAVADGGWGLAERLAVEGGL